MRKAFVVGHPITHSRSPLIHGHWLRQHGIDGSYERINVPVDRFEEFFRGMGRAGFAGGNVTIPHKESAFRLVDTLTRRAETVGAVNTVMVDTDGRTHGDNTDVQGFVGHLDQSLGGDWPARSGDTAIVLGAGGAARAIVAGLAERGVSRIRIANRTVERAHALVEIAPNHVDVLSWEELPAALSEAGLLINTTSLGMIGHPPLDVDISPLPATAVVADIVYAPLETRLLATARARGLAVVDGLGMLLHQAVPGFEAWFGVRPKVTSDLRDAIVADLTG